MMNPEQAFNSATGPKQLSEHTAEQLREQLSPVAAGTGTEFEKIVMADLVWEGAAPVKGVGSRFLIPVPDLGAESLEHTIKNWKGENEIVSGYKFRNLTDTADQAVSGDGSGVIILAIDAETVDGPKIASIILERIELLGGVASLNTARLDELLQYIREELKVSDMYNSNDSIASTMQAQQGLRGPGERPFGYYQKADKAGPTAVFVARAAEVLDGPHAGTAKYPGGFMAVRIPAKDPDQADSYRSIAPEAVAYCYVNADGSTIYVGDLPQR